MSDTNSNRLGELVTELLGAQQVAKLVETILSESTPGARQRIADAALAAIEKQIADDSRTGQTLERVIHGVVYGHMKVVADAAMIEHGPKITARLLEALPGVIDKAVASALDETRRNVTARILRATA